MTTSVFASPGAILHSPYHSPYPRGRDASFELAVQKVLFNRFNRQKDIKKQEKLDTQKIERRFVSMQTRS